MPFGAPYTQPISQVESDYYGAVKPGITADLATTDIGHEARKRVRELLKQGLEYYGRVALEDISKKAERLKTKRQQRFGPSILGNTEAPGPEEAYRLQQEQAKKTNLILIVAVVGAVAYYLYRRG